jgi:hypothetical protein
LRPGARRAMPENKFSVTESVCSSGHRTPARTQNL